MMLKFQPCFRDSIALLVRLPPLTAAARGPQAQIDFPITLSVPELLCPSLYELQNGCVKKNDVKKILMHPRSDYFLSMLADSPNDRSLLSHEIN